MYKRQKISEEKSIPRQADPEQENNLGMGSSSWLKIKASLAKSVAAQKDAKAKKADSEAQAAHKEEQ